MNRSKDRYYYSDGSILDYMNHKKVLHREYDMPAIEGANGTYKWFTDGIITRLNGPAVIWYDGSKEWWVDATLLFTDNHLRFEVALTIEDAILMYLAHGGTKEGILNYV